MAAPVEVELDKSIFRAYDIRGVLGKTLTAGVARQIGRAIGSEARDRGLKEIVVARDGRLSGPELSGALIEGLRSTGCNVIDIGPAPTPVLYFATYHLNVGSGVMVTGSHNPPDYNGFKIMLGGETLAESAITGLYTRIKENRFADGSGGLQKMDVAKEYIERITGDVMIEHKLRVVVDCGNGIAGAIAPAVLEGVGCEVLPMYCDVDGNFPNHHPDPSDVRNLQDLILSVKQMNADLGLAFDGDGDRLGVVTATGEVIFPDRLLMLFARDVLTRSSGRRDHLRREMHGETAIDDSAGGRKSDHVEDGTFADQIEDARNGRRTGRRNERPLLFPRALVRFRRRHLCGGALDGNSCRGRRRPHATRNFRHFAEGCEYTGTENSSRRRR